MNLLKLLRTGGWIFAKAERALSEQIALWPLRPLPVEYEAHRNGSERDLQEGRRATREMMMIIQVKMFSACEVQQCSKIVSVILGRILQEKVGHSGHAFARAF